LVTTAVSSAVSPPLVVIECRRGGSRWLCRGCNSGHGIMDDVKRLEKRITFLKKFADYH
jgi:hypothetical protein